MAQQQSSVRAMDDALWMRCALDLARHGAGLASPNPAVGAMLIRGGRVMGEGFHAYEGRKHAEILALEQAGKKAAGATLYINLEPCSHTGRTGPCADALIGAGVRRVVAAMRDPNPSVAGRGFRKLRTAGIKVEIGLQEGEARRLNAAFARWITARLPFVTLKAAVTLDGQLALPRERPSKRPPWISSRESRAEVHRMRHSSDALVTGIGTILADDPLLTDRSSLPRRRRLLRVILDSKLRLPLRSRIVRAAKNDVLVFTAMPANHPRAKLLRKAGIEIVHLASKKTFRQPNLRDVLKELGRREIISVLLEAGSRLNSAALASDLVDRIVIFQAPTVSGRTESPLADPQAMRNKKLWNVNVQRFGPDICIEADLRKPSRTLPPSKKPRRR
ncbi:MAG TPA: bifunctional diaminohydroxyphosphoribosylaminopyrimidine deaminase/5-amino-6-(5-phosphoribosylamino)uracil reductase RibD [Candidatus Acidoferrales bacterium]|nr:bifunctional diaminohydroxyphosphoribosylaminopyrimidine deaminase/5-amino-6-(5-phosphoribosylamino)uracil reductase RibD [Candidatus Acidoferrales bacterium]